MDVHLSYACAYRHALIKLLCSPLVKRCTVTLVEWTRWRLQQVTSTVLRHPNVAYPYNRSLSLVIVTPTKEYIYKLCLWYINVYRTAYGKTETKTADNYILYRLIWIRSPTYSVSQDGNTILNMNTTVS